MGTDWLESGSKILVWTNFCDVGVGLELTGEVAKIFGIWIEFKVVFCRSTRVSTLNTPKGTKNAKVNEINWCKTVRTGMTEVGWTTKQEQTMPKRKAPSQRRLGHGPHH